VFYRRSSSPISSRLTLYQWYQTPLGRRLGQVEARFLNRSIKVPYSFRLVQLGKVGWEKNYLDSGYLPRFVVVDEHDNTSVPCILSRLDSLPLASESIDVLILLHTLEYAPDQHQLLREVERVLKPEGQTFILGFHPWSFYRLYAYFPGGRHAAPWRGRPISQHTLLDRLNLLNFAAEILAYYDFHALYPSCQSGWRGYCAALWSVGYAVQAIKRTYTMLPIHPITEPCPDWAPGIASPIQRKVDGTKGRDR
jgi:SAM-dependent methyltransferase